MIANENLCIDPLNRSLCLQASVSGREQPCHFSQLVVICVLFGPGAGGPSLGFRLHSSQGDLTSYLIIPPVLPPVGTHPTLSNLHQTPYQSVSAEADSSVCPTL